MNGLQYQRVSVAGFGDYQPLPAISPDDETNSCVEVQFITQSGVRAGKTL